MYVSAPLRSRLLLRLRLLFVLRYVFVSVCFVSSCVVLAVLMFCVCVLVYVLLLRVVIGWMCLALFCSRYILVLVGLRMLFILYWFWY